MFLRYFLHAAKSTKNRSLSGSSRFCKPRISPPKQHLSTNKIKTFPKGDSRFCKPRISTQNYNFALTQLNPLPLRGNSYFLLGTKSRTKKRPIRGSTLRVLCAACGGSEAWASPRLTGAASRRFSRRQAWLRSWQIAEIPHIKAP